MWSESQHGRLEKCTSLGSTVYLVLPQASCRLRKGSSGGPFARSYGVSTLLRAAPPQCRQRLHAGLLLSFKRMIDQITFPAESSPRAPNSKEICEIWEWIKRVGHDEAYNLNESDWYKGFWIAVFNEYCTGGPGYCGKLMYLIWDGFPDACTVFTWEHGKLREHSSHADCGSCIDS